MFKFVVDKNLLNPDLEKALQRVQKIANSDSAGGARPVIGGLRFSDSSVVLTENLAGTSVQVTGLVKRRS